MNPRTMASPGFEPVGAAGVTVATFAARHGSQYNAPPTLRVHSGHIGFPQLRAYPLGSTLLWTAQFIPFSLSSPQSKSQNPREMLLPLSNCSAFLALFYLGVLCGKSFAVVFAFGLHQ